MVRLRKLSSLLLALSVPLWSGCGSSADNSDAVAALSAPESVSEISGSLIGGAISVSSSSEALQLNSVSARDLTSQYSQADTTVVCPVLGKATCSSGSISLTYNNCIAATETWKGVDQFRFTAGSCSNSPEKSTATYVRTFPQGMTQTNSTGRTITSDTSSPSGWQTPIAGGGTTVSIDAVAGTRSIAINGVHMVSVQVIGRGAQKKSTTIWDHTVSTSSPIVFDQNARTIASGSMKIQDNLNQLTAVINITAPLVFRLGVCNPVSGTITSTLSGSLTDSQTLTYLGGNQADLVSASGKHSTVNLTHCF